MKMGEEVVKSLDSTLNASEVSDISADISSILQGFDEERLEGTSMMIEGLIPDCITESVLGEELWEKVKGDISKIWMITGEPRTNEHSRSENGTILSLELHILSLRDETASHL
ncbi:hypothetical protein TL16_g05049 [Triparma laevis f. inornata]|uniref:Uncharacterized protein n=1 Tax=Triparma laevis f. inornata TaxID=1714386 RepID=A0A9W7AGX6_9STRA|nr:hypothetical protein TL16_g05049 [Triparma laevis f. inornata]